MPINLLALLYNYKQLVEKVLQRSYEQDHGTCYEMRDLRGGVTQKPEYEVAD